MACRHGSQCTYVLYVQIKDSYKTNLQRGVRAFMLVYCLCDTSAFTSRDAALPPTVSR